MIREVFKELTLQQLILTTRGSFGELFGVSRSKVGELRFVSFLSSTMAEQTCIFCKIARKEDPNTEIQYESETIVIFSDIRPGSDFHYLAIPKVHLKNAKFISAEHVPLRECRQGCLR